MGLQKKISLWFAGVLIIVALVGYAGLSMTLRPAFDDLEDRASRQDLARVRNNLEAQQAMLSKFTVDWAQWDETYRYMLGTNPDFANNNIEVASLVGIDVDLMALYDTDRNFHSGLVVDSETGMEATIEDLGLDAAAFEVLFSHSRISVEISGLIKTRSGPMLLSSRPITWTNITGPALGTLIIGRLLDESRIAEISSNAEVAMTLMPPAHVDPDSRSDAMFGQVFQSVEETARNNDQVLHDVRGRPVATLHVTSTRDVSTLGMNTTASVLVLFASLGLLTMLVLSLVLRSLIIEPISKLKAMMMAVEESEDVSGRVNLDRPDEIGDLADSFDDMLGKLEQMKQQNIEQSFKAGMAEVAAGVLHNVRNSLMPIMNNVAMARDAMMRRSDTNVTLAIGEIGEPDTDAARREKLLTFVNEAHERTIRNRAAGIEHLGHVLDQLDHASEILRDQEKYTHAKPILETVNLGEVIDAARGVIPVDVLAGISIIVKPAVGAIKVRAHRVGLMQVIGNLLVNAVESIARRNVGVGTIWIDAMRDIDASKNVAVLTIRDDGVGIAEDKLLRLFDRGYSTKDGSSGEGLHWSANALAGMGGEISARSDGADKGAEFRIVLQPAQGDSGA